MRHGGSAASALLILIIIGILATGVAPANAHNKSAPVKNALVVLSPQGDPALQAVLRNGGTPSTLERSLGLTEGLLAAHALRAITAQNGSFTINTPDAVGSYNVSVSATGFVVPASAGNSFNIGGASGPENFTLVVQPSAVLSGRVTDSGGHPLEGITVSLGNQPNSANYDVTSADGIFVLDTGLATGHYVVHAFKPDTNIAKFNELLRSLEEGLASQPGASPEIMAQNAIFADGHPSDFISGHASQGYEPYNGTVTLEQGKLTTLNIQLNDSKLISGTISSKSDGKPVPGIGVFVFDTDGSLVSSAITNSSGRYLIDNGLGQGTYRVSIPSAVSGYFAPANLEISVPGMQLNSANLALEPSQVITGNVIDRNGVGISNSTVIAIAEGANPGQLQFFDSSLAGMGIAKTGPDGVFRISGGLASGRYLLAVYYGDVLPVSGNAVIDTTLSRAVTIRLDFSEIVTISGMITNASGAPIAGARILPSFATSIPGSDGFAALSGTNGTFDMSVPIRDSTARSLFDQIIVSAPGYATATANMTVGNGKDMKVVLLKSTSQLTGRVVTQESDSPPLESALGRIWNLAVSDRNAMYWLSIKSNTKVIGAAFEAPNERLALDFEGMQGPGGITELTIPRGLMSRPFAVFVDGDLLSPQDVTLVSQNNTSSTVSFRHDHGLSQAILVRQDSQLAPELPYAATLTIASISLVVIIARFMGKRQRDIYQ